MNNEEFFEKWGFSIEGTEFEDLILEKADDQFMSFWVTSFGKPSKDHSKAEYVEKLMFVLTGWLAAKKHIKPLAPVEDSWLDRLQVLKDRIDFFINDDEIKDELLKDVERWEKTQDQ